MIHERDERGTETTAERTERLARERYAAARVGVRESGAWTKWKNLKPPVRFFLGALIIFAVVAGVIALLQWMM